MGQEEPSLQLDPNVPVFSDRMVKGWPRSSDKTSIGTAPLHIALSRTYHTDAHTAAYYSKEHPDVRLTRLAVGETDITIGVFIVDVDCPEAHKTGKSAPKEWRDTENKKLQELSKMHPDYLVTHTRGGYRIFWHIDPFTIESKDSEKQWKVFYCRTLLHLFREFGIEGDTNCRDWTHLYRLPFVTRQGVPQTHQVIGAMHQIGRLAYKPDEASYLQDLATAKELGLTPICRLLSPTSVTTVIQNDNTEVPAEIRVKLAAAYIEASPPAVSGEGGHDTFFTIAKEACRGFDLTNDQALDLFLDYNERCLPPFSESEVEHKIEEAQKADTPSRGSKLMSDSFVRTAQGNLLKNNHNIRLALKKSNISFRFNEHTHKIEVKGILNESVFNDYCLKYIIVKLDTDHNLYISNDSMDRTVSVLAKESSYHPIRERIAELEWDGEERLENWLTTYAGAEESEFNAAVGKILFVAALRRIKNPGCKFDTMVVLEGKQGGGKSTLIQKLALEQKWFSDHYPMKDNQKLVLEQTEGKWIIELAELNGLRKNEIDEVKSNLSRQVDSARLAYGHYNTERPRSFIVIGTTNDAEYLKDTTGNRRFLPVKVGTIDLEALDRDLDQLYAEAKCLEQEGFSLMLPQSLWKTAENLQSSRMSIDYYEEKTALVTEHITHGRFLITTLQDAIGVAQAYRNSSIKDLSRSLLKLGFDKKRKTIKKRKYTFYYIGDFKTAPYYDVDSYSGTLVERVTSKKEPTDLPF